jgi:hypothetical protein
MYILGKRVRIKEWLAEEPVKRGSKYFRKVMLCCGHKAEVSVGLSPNHYRVGSREEPKTVRCIPCWKLENKI